MKLPSVLRSTGLFAAMAFAAQANAVMLGSFNGSLGSITPWENTVNGNLAADVAADPYAPFDLGTLFNASFSYDETTPDTNPSPNVGTYGNALQTFSIVGGSINSSSNSGFVRVANDEIYNGLPRDNFQLGALGINDLFTINGNTWVLNSAHIILNDTGSTASSAFTSDSLDQSISGSTAWSWERGLLKFSLQGVADSEHYVRIGAGQPDQFVVDVTPAPPAPAIDVATPATLPLLAASFGLLVLRRRRD